MNRIIFHIDVNSAYLSWTSVENLKDPEGIDLRLTPSIIGGDRSSRHGVVLAKSIPAKAYHIHTGEPIAAALKKCPNLLIQPPNHRLYSEYSHRLMDFLKQLTPDIEQVSVDECYVDYTGISHLYDSPVSAATQIKDTIYDQFGFTVNIGISSNKLLAKMASDFEKPGKVHTLFPTEIQTKMWPLPVAELYMAGKASVTTLQKLGIYTIGDLALTDPCLLTPHLKSHGKMLWEYANGIDNTPLVSTPEKAKGIGNSTTLAADVTTARDAKAVLLKLAASVSGRLRKAGQLAGNVCVEIKYSTFTVSSHQMQLLTPSNTEKAVYRASCQLFDALWDQTPIRLLGIRCSKLVSDDTPVQLSLFDLPASDNAKQKKLDQALDSIRLKFGSSAVTRASMLPPKEELDES